jgi:hypothetical protein
VENQDAAMRRRDLTTAQKIIDRHRSCTGAAWPSKREGPGGVAQDIADPLANERGG